LEAWQLPWERLVPMVLQKITTDEKILKAFQTGVQYQLYHALALLATAALYNKYYSSLVKWAANFLS
jgi:uncharacterized membrane protein YgdD (TMEM256/DUF423 family)